MEVFHAVELPGGAFPGAAQLARYAEDECLPLLESLLLAGRVAPNVGMTSLEPTEKSWAAGDRELLCLLENKTLTRGSATGMS